MKKIKNLLKKTVVPAFLVVFCMTFMAVPVYAASDSYTSTLSFQGEYGGKSRQYNHQNIMYAAGVESYIGGKKIAYNSSVSKSLVNNIEWNCIEKLVGLQKIKLVVLI